MHRLRAISGSRQKSLKSSQNGCALVSLAEGVAQPSLIGGKFGLVVKLLSYLFGLRSWLAQ